MDTSLNRRYIIKLATAAGKLGGEAWEMCINARCSFFVIK